MEDDDETYVDDDCEIRRKYDMFVLYTSLYTYPNSDIFVDMTEMTRKAVVEVETEVGRGGDGEEVGAVRVVVAGRGIIRGANILVDTETIITRMIITEIGVPRSVFSL